MNARSEKACKIYNKLGQAYGFSIDNAYVQDLETGKAFFLTACLYTNKNEVLNDNKYEYELLAEPFLSFLAEACCFELEFTDPGMRLTMAPTPVFGITPVKVCEESSTLKKDACTIM